MFKKKGKVKKKIEEEANEEPEEETEEEAEEEDEGEEDEDEGEEEAPKKKNSLKPKPLSSQEVLTVAEDHIARAVELIRYARLRK